MAKRTDTAYLDVMIKISSFTRRALLAGLGVSAVGAACSRATSETVTVSTAANSALADVDKWRSLTDADWRERLDNSAFRVLRLEGTEPSFSSALNDEKRDGVFHCAGCDLPLFSSETKYDSGTGWPSFWKPISETALGTKPDNKLWYTRTEYHCARCLGHQGHVFEDGPRPTGLRYCNNGLALTFRPA
ncbi:MAG: peptide-methionine (R)-S-oxide reductase MsrB [Pseudomonadota bacterium]